MDTATNNMEPQWAKPELQQARSELRRQFLRTLESFIGRKCSIKMFDNSTLTARFNGCDLGLQNILVTSLHTPSGVLESAILRDIDVLHIDFEDSDVS